MVPSVCMVLYSKHDIGKVPAPNGMIQQNAASKVQIVLLPCYFQVQPFSNKMVAILSDEPNPKLHSGMNTYTWR